MTHFPNLQSVDSRKAECERALRDESHQITSDIADLTATTPYNGCSVLIAQAKACLSFFGAYLQAYEGLLQRMAQHREKRGDFLRYVQWLHDCVRPAKMPNPLDTILMMVIYVLAEGGLVAVMMVTGGRMDVMSGAAYGLTFAAITAAAGLCIGFFCLRYCAYKLRSPAPDRYDGAIRAVAIASFTTLTAFLGLILFASARTRATGSHEAIFDFSEVGFLATFGDGIALVILLVGVLGILLSIYHGYCHLSDPVPGLTDARRYAEGHINDQVADLVDGAEAHVLDRAESFLEDAEDAVEAFRELEASRRKAVCAVNERIDGLNAQIDTDKNRIRAWVRDQASARARIVRSTHVELIEPDFSSLDALRMEPVQLQDFMPDDRLRGEMELLSELIVSVSTELENALARIHAAEAEFHACAPDLDIVPTLKG